MDALGDAGPPRRNGELVFESPWESRVFGMTLSLFERGLFEWDEFRDCLSEEIGGWDRAHPDAARSADGEGYRYWDRWLAAFQALLERKGLCDASAIETREREFAARPHGHDH